MMCNYLNSEVATTWYRLTVITFGAVDSEDEFDSSEEADSAAEMQASLLRREAIADWDIYLTPHYCDREDSEGECTCVQYLQDHHPAYSSGSEDDGS